MAQENCVQRRLPSMSFASSEAKKETFAGGTVRAKRLASGVSSGGLFFSDCVHASSWIGG